MVVPLLVIVLLLVLMVVVGKLLYPPPPSYVSSDRPVRHVALSSGVIYSAGRPTDSIEPGDTVWVIRAGNGIPVLYTDSTGAQALGVAEVLLAPVGASDPGAPGADVPTTSPPIQSHSEDRY